MLLAFSALMDLDRCQCQMVGVSDEPVGARNVLCDAHETKTFDIQIVRSDIATILIIYWSIQYRIHIHGNRCELAHPVTNKKAITMTKRTADRQITKDDAPDSDTAAEDQGEGFVKADAETLAKRRIVRVKRPTNTSTTSSSSSTAKSSSNPFGGVHLSTSTSSKSVFGTSFGFSSGNSVFGGSSTFSGFGQAAKSTNTFGFGSAVTKSTSTTDSDKKTEDDTSKAKEEQKLVVQLPQNVDIVSGEEDAKLLYTVRSKTFQLVAAAAAQTPAAHDVPHPSVPPSSSTASVAKDKKEGDEWTWKEVGIGPLKLLQEEDSFRLVQHRQVEPTGAITKLLWNLPLYSSTKVTAVNDKNVRVDCINPQQGVVRLLIRTRLASDSIELMKALENTIQQAKSLGVGKKTLEATETKEETKAEEDPEKDEEALLDEKVADEEVTEKTDKKTTEASGTEEEK